MTKFILFVAMMFIMTSCYTDYEAKLYDSVHITIRDTKGIIEKAVERGQDSVYIVSHGTDEHYHPLDWMGKRHSEVSVHTLSDGREYVLYSDYYVVPMSSIKLEKGIW